MLEVDPIWVSCSSHARITQAYLPHGKSEPNWPGPAQVSGIYPVYLGAVKPNITVSHINQIILTYILLIYRILYAVDLG